MVDTGMLVFGGCNIRGPLYRACGQRDRREELGWRRLPTGLSVRGPHFRTFTVGEMLQALDCFRGERRIPPDLYDLCHMTAETAPTPENNPLADAEIALVEPNTSVEIVFDGYYLNRDRLARFLRPLDDVGQVEKKLSSQWYKKGIIGADEKLKREVAAQLIPMVPDHFPNRDLLVAVLRGASRNIREIQVGLRMLKGVLDIPTGVVTYTYAYMPDGRAVSWPATFNDEVIAAAMALDLPLFQPRLIVQSADLNFALRDDLRHYTEAFMVVLAKPLIEFAQSVAASGVK